MTGIEYLHGLEPQIVHGDIRGVRKPASFGHLMAHPTDQQANVLVTEDFRCVLADFGLSHVRESQAPVRSSMFFVGAMRWLPPEMMDFSLYQDARSHRSAADIYSFGCTLVEVRSLSFSSVKVAHCSNRYTPESRHSRISRQKWR